MKIFILEDDKDKAARVLAVCAHMGPNITVTTATDYKTGQEINRNQEFDLYFIDACVPEYTSEEGYPSGRMLNGAGEYTARDITRWGTRKPKVFISYSNIERSKLCNAHPCSFNLDPFNICCTEDQEQEAHDIQQWMKSIEIPEQEEV